MQLNIEHITQDSRFWDWVNILAREAFPPEEYLAPTEHVKMERSDNFDFLVLLDDDVYNDGTVLLVHTPGHGLFSVMIRGKDKYIVLGNDGAYGKGIPSKMVSCKDVSARGALCDFGRFCQQRTDDLDLIRRINETFTF